MTFMIRISNKDFCLFTYFDCLPEYSSSCVYFYPSYKTSPHLCYWFLHSLHYRAPSPGLPSLRNFKQQSCRDEDEQLPRTSSICTPGQLKRQITLQGFMVFFLLKNTVDKKTKQKNAHCHNLHQIFVPCVCTNKNACLFPALNLKFILKMSACLQWECVSYSTSSRNVLKWTCVWDLLLSENKHWQWKREWNCTVPFRLWVWCGYICGA